MFKEELRTLAFRGFRLQTVTNSSSLVVGLELFCSSGRLILTYTQDVRHRCSSPACAARARARRDDVSAQPQRDRRHSASVVSLLSVPAVPSTHVGRVVTPSSRVEVSWSHECCVAAATRSCVRPACRAGTGACRRKFPSCSVSLLATCTRLTARLAENIEGKKSSELYCVKNIQGGARASACGPPDTTRRGSADDKTDTASRAPNRPAPPSSQRLFDFHAWSWSWAWCGRGLLSAAAGCASPTQATDDPRKVSGSAGQACFWFNNGCDISCDECDGKEHEAPVLVNEPAPTHTYDQVLS